MRVWGSGGLGSEAFREGRIYAFGVRVQGPELRACRSGFRVRVWC